MPALVGADVWVHCLSSPSRFERTAFWVATTRAKCRNSVTVFRALPTHFLKRLASFETSGWTWCAEGSPSAGYIRIVFQHGSPNHVTSD